MARTKGSSAATTLAAIRTAGLRQIHARGFEAMSLRALAAETGLQTGSLYKYYRHKQDLLFDLLHRIMTALHEGLDGELAGTTNPVDALSRFVAFHLRWHTARRMEVFIGNMELRSLSPANRKRIIALRTRYEDRLRAILEAGNRARVWRVADPRITTFAIIAMLTGTCTWYRPTGRLSQARIIALYRDMVLASVGLKKGH